MTNIFLQVLCDLLIKRIIFLGLVENYTHVGICNKILKLEPLCLAVSLFTVHHSATGAQLRKRAPEQLCREPCLGERTNSPKKKALNVLPFFLSFESV